MTKFIVFRGEKIPLEKDDSGLYTSPDGTIFALREDGDSVDLIDRCGVGIFSLSKNNPLTAYCARHDYMYSSPAFQLFHTREEADRYLQYLIKTYPLRWWFKPIANPIYEICHFLGSLFWDNKKTA